MCGQVRVCKASMEDAWDVGVGSKGLQNVQGGAWVCQGDQEKGCLKGLPPAKHNFRDAGTY